ncbi:SEL1-like repeat protein [Helicobacter suis]|uniref:tetratricopeptide repeat protein n=1 Tax=Helicobacter suis TaxID=104628 RepID=UPI0022036E04|nr:tetratricopeptide repeat protein [Helicobacter suis]BDR27818.1 hypothetical protein HSHS1_05790 [Helicobacter suis HS1]
MLVTGVFIVRVYAFEALEPVNPSLQQGLVRQANPGISEKCINGQRLFNTFPSILTLMAASVGCAPPDNIKLNPYVQEGLIEQSHQQDKKAYQSFLTASKEGDLFGTALLGTLYLDGKGVPKNIARAETYFNEVLKSHEAKKAMKDYVEFVSLGGTAGTHSKYGSVILATITARLGLAQIYASTNPKKAFKIYKSTLASMQSHALILYLLLFVSLPFAGVLYVIFSPLVRRTGLRLKSLHANQFDPYIRELIGFALYKIGMAYKEGRGVKVKLKKATEFLKKAVDFGNDKAIEALRSLQ